MQERVLMSVQEAAESLAVSVRWLRGQIGEGALPVVRFGRRVLVRPEDRDAFVEERRLALGGDNERKFP